MMKCPLQYFQGFRIDVGNCVGEEGENGLVLIGGWEEGLSCFGTELDFCIDVDDEVLQYMLGSVWEWHERCFISAVEWDV